MNYKIDIIIKAQKEDIARLYVDKLKMPLWEKGLTRIVDVKGKLFDTDSFGQLIFSFDQHTIVMDVSVEENKLPDSITQIFKVPGVVNRCKHEFIALGNETQWVMDVTFEFDVDPQIPEKRFHEKTMASMLMFKHFVEKEMMK